MEVPMRKSVVVVVALLSGVVAGNGLAEMGDRYLFPTVGPEIEAQLDGPWGARLQKLSHAAYGERWDELARNAESLGEGLAQTRHRDSRPFAIVAAYRALAAAALGEDADAVWHWQVALNLWPDLDYEELARAFEVAPELSNIGLPPFRASRKISDGGGQAPPPGSRPPSLDPRTDVRLGFMLGPFRDAKTPPFIFSAQLMIGVDGRQHSPRVLTVPWDRGAETYSALEALRRWRYTPATVNGEPVEATNTVSQGIGEPPAGARKRRY
jgi:hypothetical protein